MRGADVEQGGMFSYVSVESRACEPSAAGDPYIAG